MTAHQYRSAFDPLAPEQSPSCAPSVAVAPISSCFETCTTPDSSSEPAGVTRRDERRPVGAGAGSGAGSGSRSDAVVARGQGPADLWYGKLFRSLSASVKSGMDFIRVDASDVFKPPSVDAPADASDALDGPSTSATPSTHSLGLDSAASSSASSSLSGRAYSSVGGSSRGSSSAGSNEADARSGRRSVRGEWPEGARASGGGEGRVASALAVLRRTISVSQEELFLSSRAPAVQPAAAVPEVAIAVPRQLELV